MTDFAHNPETGAVVMWDGQGWVPAEIARNPRTGAVVAFNGREWQPVPITPPERGTVEKVERGVGLFGQGMNNAIGSAIGALPDMVGAGLRAVGLPSSKPGQYTEWAQRGLNALGRNDTPETPIERNALATGEGVGDALSVLAPAGAVGTLAKSGSMAQKVGAALASQPALQLASGAAGGSVAQATDNPWMGMAASLAVPAAVSVGRGLLSPGAGGVVNDETRRLMDVAKQEGIELTPAQITNSRPLKTMESVFTTLPTTAGPQARLVEDQRQQFNRAVLGKAGMSGDLATPDVLKAGLDRAGQEIATIAGRNTMQIAPGDLPAITQIAQDFQRTFPKDVAKPVVQRVLDFIDKIDPKASTVSGKEFAALDSTLARQIRNTGDGNVRQALTDLRETLRGVMERSISPADAEAWTDARRNYAVGSTIRDAMNSPSIPSTAGHISPSALAREVAEGPQANYAMGRGALNDLSRVGKAFIQEQVPNSGTPERLAVQGLLTGGTLGGAALSGANPATTAALTAMSLGLPRGVQALYNSPAGRAYLTNTVADRLIGRPSQAAVGGITLAQAKALLEDRK